MNILDAPEVFAVRPIGFILSALHHLEDCPLQGSGHAPAANLVFHPAYMQGSKNIRVGDQLIILTWLHLADRNVLQCYKGNLVGTEEFGVFSTRSPGRPNPIGLHNVTVYAIVDERTITIFPIEALNGTPVIDIKPVI